MTMPVPIARFFWAVALSIGAVGIWFLLTDPALAQGAGTDSGGMGNFYCSGGKAYGSLYNSNPSCPTTLGFNNIFSFLVCNMEKLSSDLMGGMFCGMITSLRPMVIAAMTLAVVIFGTGFTIGVIPATAREFQKFLIKIAFVFAFATQADLLIGVAYKGLVGGAREGVVVALQGLYKNAGVTDMNGAGIYAQLDAFLAKAIGYATDYIGAKWDGSSGDNACQNAIFAVLGIMLVIFPPVFYISLLLIGRIAITFVRAVFGYIYAVVGIAFLLTLAPFFLSFYLFMATRPYFDKWLGYLVSFAMQIMIVFAFLTFVVSIDVKNLSSSLVDLVVPVQESPETTSLRFNWKYCTLCEFEVVETQADGSEKVIPPEQYKGFLGNGKMRCKTFTNATTGQSEKRPIRVMSGVAPNTDMASKDTTIQNALLKFTGTALLSLLVLAYIVDALLMYAPSLAQLLAGAMGGTYAPQLGGGYNKRGITTMDIPGLQATGQGNEYTGVLGSFERGFDRGFNTNSGTSIERTFKGLREGFDTATKGSNLDRKGRTLPEEARLDLSPQEKFLRFLTNPLGETKE